MTPTNSVDEQLVACLQSDAIFETGHPGLRRFAELPIDYIRTLRKIHYPEAYTNYEQYWKLVL